MSELKIDSERVKEAAKSCPDVARVMKTLFPDVFKEEKSPYLEMEIEGAPTSIYLGSKLRINGRTEVIQVRGSGRFAFRGLYLSLGVDWEIITDETGAKILVAKKKS